jgi:hypothetical protein
MRHETTYAMRIPLYPKGSKPAVRRILLSIFAVPAEVEHKRRTYGRKLQDRNDDQLRFV